MYNKLLIKKMLKQKLLMFFIPLPVIITAYVNFYFKYDGINTPDMGTIFFVMIAAFLLIFLTIPSLIIIIRILRQLDYVKNYSLLAIISFSIGVILLAIYLATASKYSTIAEAIDKNVFLFGSMIMFICNSILLLGLVLDKLNVSKFIVYFLYIISLPAFLPLFFLYKTIAETDNKVADYKVTQVDNYDERVEEIKNGSEITLEDIDNQI